MPEHESPPEERELLDAIDAALAAPAELASSQLLFQAQQKLPLGYTFSPVAHQRLRALAARRADQHRGIHQVLIGVLMGQADVDAIAFMLDMLPDDGLSTGAVDSLDRIDPAVAAPPLRAWLAGRDPEALPNPLMIRALRAKIDLAVPPPDGAAVPVTEELLEYWVQRGDLAALRLALARGASAKATISHGETLLHYAMDAWANASEDDEDNAFDPSRAAWEAFIVDLIAAGAETGRKLVGRFSGGGERRWTKGTTPRGMLDGERKRGELPAEVIDRLEAKFPVTAGALLKARARKTPAPAPKVTRDITFRRQVDEPLAGLRGTALGPALDKALAVWTDATLAQQPFGPWGYATSLLDEIAREAPEAAAKAPGWMGLLLSPAARLVHKVVIMRSREEERLLRDMTLASLERDLLRVDLAGWPEDAATLIRKETRVGYREGAFLIGKKKGDTTALWEASREGVVDLGTVQPFLTSLVEATRKALLG